MFSAPIPENDDRRLTTLYRYAILDSPLEQGYEDVAALASYICATPFSTITFVDAERQWFKSEIGFGTKETGRAEGFCACALLNPEPLIVEDTLNDPRFAENAFVLNLPKIRFYAGAPLVAPNGQILGTVCVFDTRPRVLTTEQINALVSLSRQVMALLETRLRGQERERAAAALLQNEKLAAVGRLASSMAHAINNPLEAVTNILFLLRSKITDDEGRAWVDQADLELRRVSVIANQTLRFHKQVSDPQSVTCVSLFSATLDAYKARLANAQIAVKKRKHADQPVLCFEGDIRQVLGAVITNSIDAMPNGGRLLLRSRQGMNWKTGQPSLILTIADDGPGMDIETDHRKFEAFYSTKGISGSGLGLWMSAEIMHRHGGDIKIRTSHSHLHHGTVVQLFLPFLSKAPRTWASDPTP
jgi:signal transduction histidine kinase